MMGTANSDTTPLSVYLPFNREVLGTDFAPGKGGSVPKEGDGNWVLVQDQNLLVVPDGEQYRLPSGACPISHDTFMKIEPNRYTQ